MSRRAAAMLFATLAGSLLFAGGAHSAIPSVPPVEGPLRTSGNQILDAAGTPLVLRGVAREVLDYWPSLDGSHLWGGDISAMHSWGANVVRIPLGEQFWNSNECSYSPGYRSLVDKVVEAITSRGMVALLDLHVNTRLPCMQAQPQRMADYPGSVTFWTEVAQRYKANPLVAFQLYNEPHDISWSVWRNGGLVIDSDWMIWTAAGMQQLYDAVRSTGAQNLVFASGNVWGNDPPPSSALLSGYNIVYAAQYYTCSDAPPPLCTVPDPTNPAPAAGKRLDAWGTFTTKYPVAVTEFGWPETTDGRYNANVIAWAEAHGASWLAYHWSAPDNSYSLGDSMSRLLNSLAAPTRPTWELLATYGPDYRPNGAGVPVRTGLAKNLVAP
jgi:endoglucanase